MRQFPFYQVDAFASQPFAGNPAAVLILEDWLADDYMLAIAEENNIAITSFVRPADAGWELRWFMPTMEADFCGHGTLATAHVLATERGVGGDFVFTTRAGAQFRTARHWFVELADEQAVRNFTPDLAKIATLHPLSFAITAPGNEHDFVSRHFAPGAGVPEDSVTGSTHSALVPYWARKLGKDHLTAFQCSRRGGGLSCEMDGDQVHIVGRAITYLTGIVHF